MTSEELLALNLRQIRVSFEVCISAYEQVTRTGMIEEPQLAAAALASLDDMVTSLALAGLDKVRYDGSHVNELLRRGRELPGGSSESKD